MRHTGHDVVDQPPILGMRTFRFCAWRAEIRLAVAELSGNRGLERGSPDCRLFRS